MSYHAVSMFTRRRFLLQSTLTAMGTAALGAQRPATPSIVRVVQGTLLGEERDGCHIFRGIPFARSPIGPLRFRPPQPPDPWPGIRDAISFSAAPIQPGDGSVAQSEDCLYLNLWAPAAPGPHPVFVWIHGGGFTGGRSFDPLFDGSRFARNGIVCVTVAYRLGALGFLDVSPLLGSTYAGSGSNAVRDLIAALTWLQANLSAFGGDPARVTIGGESAGAKLTDILMGVPSASPLFHQVISESGGAERIWATPAAEKVARSFGEAWTGATGSAPTQLATAPARQLIDVQTKFMHDWPAHFPLRAELDSTLIARAPLASIRSGSSRGKRLLLGTNHDESASFIGTHPKANPTASDLGNLSLNQFQLVADRYRQLYPDMPDDLRRIRSVTAEEYWIPSLRVAEAHLEGGGEAFVYRLDYPGEGIYSGLAFHGYDLRFVWNSLGKLAPDPAASHLAASMHEACAAFIHGKPPAASGLPPWPAYSLPQRPTMLFNQASRIELAPSAAEYALWNGLLTS